MRKPLLLGIGALAILGAAAWLVLGSRAKDDSVQLLNVSYDPTRELWRDLNERFSAPSMRNRRRHAGHSAIARRLGNASPGGDRRSRRRRE